MVEETGKDVEGGGQWKHNRRKKKDLVHLTLILAEEHRATALENPIGSCRESMKKTRGIGASSHYLSHR